MSNEGLSLIQQNLRIANEFVRRAECEFGFHALCMVNASVRILSSVAVSILKHGLANDSRNGLANSADEGAFSPLTNMLSNTSLVKSITSPKITELVNDRSSWLYGLAHAERSLAEKTPLKSAENQDSSLIASSVSSEAQHWSRLSHVQLSQWCKELRLLCELLEHSSYEY